MPAGSFSGCPHIPKFNLAMVVIVPYLIGLPSITSNFLDSFSSFAFQVVMVDEIFVNECYSSSSKIYQSMGINDFVFNFQ
jgi:hypothetical protein